MIFILIDNLTKGFMKKIAKHSLFFIFGALILLSLGYIASETTLFTQLQNDYALLDAYSAPPLFPLYARILIVILLVISIIFLYRNRIILKQEIAHRKQVEKEAREKGESLEKSLALSKATLEATADGILVVDANRQFAGHNNKFAEMWRVPPDILLPGNDEKAVGHILSQLKDPQGFIESLERLYNAEPDAEHLDEILFKDGRIFERYTRPQMQGDEIIGRVFSFRDVTQRKEMEQQLMHQATHDALTSLPNRIILHDRINQAIKFSQRSKGVGAILFFDLDRFKLVNDGLGHDIGDILLQAVARRLEHCVRENDTVARLGGDEFVILLNSLANEEQAIPIAAKCLKVMEEPFVIDKHTLSITSSIGISYLPKDGKTPVALLKNADSAMYHAKNEGRNNFKIYSKEMSVYNKKQLKLTNELHEAVIKNALSLYYQPLVDLKNGKIIGAEALLRWEHPVLGFISPADFIPVAEDTGLIDGIGEWVLRTACLQNKAWQKQGLPPITMAVNLSGRQFKQTHIPELVGKILEETKLEPQYLDLELTESVIMENTQAFLACMHELKDMGLNLVIDDFGTGYSSLSYLKRFPVDILKIDLSFVAGIPGSRDDTAIVRAILAMAKQLNMSVVAEGVENNSQLSFLRDNLCQKGQGFLFSKALPAKEFTSLLKKNDFQKLFKPVDKKRISLVQEQASSLS